MVPIHRRLGKSQGNIDPLYHLTKLSILLLYQYRSKLRVEIWTF